MEIGESGWSRVLWGTEGEAMPHLWFWAALDAQGGLD